MSEARITGYTVTPVKTTTITYKKSERKKADKDSNEEIDRAKGAKTTTKNVKEKEAKREIKMQVK